MRAFVCISLFLAICIVVTVGCANTQPNGIPADFIFIIDARSASDESTRNVNIQLDAKGKGRYERYNTDGSIQQDEDKMVTYSKAQIVEAGKFNLHEDDLRWLWETINMNDFFALTGDYRMAMGSAYAFIMVEADGRRHQVFNIGMEVPEIRTIVDAANEVLPQGVQLVYGEGYNP